MKKLKISVRNDQFALFCKLLENTTISVLSVLDQANSSLTIEIEYSEDLDLFNLGMSLGFYSSCFRVI